MKENWEIQWEDYYKILQVHPSVEPGVIKAAYDRLARKYHPDINKDPSAADRMKNINEAYETLADPEKRTRYSVEWRQRQGMTSRLPTPVVAPPKTKKSIPQGAIVGIILGIIFGISLYIRIVPGYDNVFVEGSVWFRENDAYYHLRLIENLLRHLPHRIYFDPYTFAPHGTAVPWPPFFDWLIAAISWIVGLGSPSPHTIEVVAAYVPAVLGSLTIIPVYFIGKELFNHWVGGISAALLIILPGEFLNRSLLGFSDHHVAEALFSAVTMLFLILAVKKAKEKEISFSHLANKDWPTIKKPLLYTLLAGIFLGIFLLTWVGGLLLVFILSLWLIIQFVIEHLRGKSTDYLCITGLLVFLIASLISFPFLPLGGLSTICRISLMVAIILPLVLSAISRLMASKGVKLAYYPLALVAIVGVGFLAFLVINPSMLGSMLGYFGIFTPAGTALTIQEVHSTTLDIAWGSYTASFFIAFISFGLLIYASIREESADKTLLLVWSVVMLIACLGQRRFSYYYAVNAVLLTGYFSWRILEAAGLKKLLARPKEVVPVFKKKKKKAKVKAQKRFLQPSVTLVRVIVTGIVIFFLVFYPNIGKTRTMARQPSLMDPAWYSSLMWLEDNSPEPFGDAEFYYELYEAPPPGKDYPYPETAYSVMSWWDYGHWITRIARRIPIANPFQQGAVEAGEYFTAQNETTANQLMDKLMSRYVIIDYSMPSGKFYAMAMFAGKNLDEFHETYYLPEGGGKLSPWRLFYPSYYYSTVARLFNFDGKAVAATNSTVISWQEKLSSEGIHYKEITSLRTFPTYEEAEANISSQKSGNYEIVGTDPSVSPVPLEPMEHYGLRYLAQTPEGTPLIKIFEYIK